MEVLPTYVDTRSETYRTNREGFLQQLAYLDEQLAMVNQAGGPKYVARHQERGKLMARERIELLLDRDSPFLEIAPLAGWGTDFALGGSVVSGIGVVSGVECVITANEPTIKGGSINPVGARKTARTMEICAQNHHQSE
jgi:acetyl-CoA carboxylase carboxyltransferase component